jgi:3-oxoacyl-[acyl-carrier protein] reductase
VIAVHLQGAFLMTQLTQVHMVKARYGRIISLSSASALGNRGRANYSAAKAGIQGFTRTLEIKLRPLGITRTRSRPDSSRPP